MAHSNITYAGTTPGTDANTYVILATTLPAAPTNAMNMNRDNACPANYAALAGIRKVALTMKHSHLGVLNLYMSADRGSNWLQMDTVSVATPASTASDLVEFQVEGMKDWKIEWVNGGTAQSPWAVTIAFSDQRASPL